MASSKPLPGKCGSRLRGRPGEYCTQKPIVGRTRCKFHGGKTLKGPASATYKTGRYSRYLGGALGDAYKHSLNDPKLLDLKESIAVLDAIAKRAAERTQDHDTPRFRARLRELWQAFTSASKVEEKAAAQVQLGELIAEGDLEDGALRFLSDSIERYSRRAEEATRLALAKHAAIPAADLVILFSRLAEAITRVAPRDVAATILAECDQLIAPLTGGGPQAPGDKEAERQRAKLERRAARDAEAG